MANFSKEFLKLFIANSDAADVAGVIEKVLANINYMKGNNKPVTDISRGYMPQTGNANQIKAELGALKTGEINYLQPVE